MLYIIGIKAHRAGAPVQEEWCIGEDIPRLTNIGSIHANGDELAEILQWENIPKVVMDGKYPPAMIWIGEMAEFIYHNLLLWNRKIND